MEETTTTISLPLSFGGFELSPQLRSVSRAGSQVKLGARAFDVLMALIERRDRIVTKDELFDIVWPGLVVEESNLQVQVSALRKLFGQTVIATIPGRGYRFVAQLDEQFRSSSDRATDVPNNLPEQRTQFIGRAKELAQCTALLREARLLTLTGVGGCGKTRLALQLAQQQLSTFRDGVRFVDLAPLQEARGVEVALAGVIGVREHTGVPLVDRLVEQLSQRLVLILFDNCEHVINAVADLCETLLSRCRYLKVVATSREGLGLKGEQLYSVQQLSLPQTNDLSAMDASEAVRLLIDRARLTMPDLALDEANAPVVADICRRLDGIALAIELAAARTALLSFEAIRDRLDDRFRLLSGGRRALPRQQTLLATMQWSYELLSPPEQHLFRQLAVVSGGCTLSAAAYIGNTSDEYGALELLTRLHDKSLLQVDRRGHAEPRYCMLETVRQYALERLNDVGEAEAARERHLEHFVALAEAAETELLDPEQGEWLARLGLEQENLLAADAWAAQAGDGGERSLRLVAALGRYWTLSDQLACGVRLARSAMQTADATVSARTRARAMFSLSRLTFMTGQYDEAAKVAQASLQLAQQIDDTKTTLRAMNWLANALSAKGEVDGPRKMMEQCCELARSNDEASELGCALISLGELHRSVGELEKAAAYYEESIRISRSSRSPTGLCAGLGNLARTHILLGQLERARAELLEGFQTAIGAGLRSVSTCALDPTAALAHALGDSERSARYFGAAEVARELSFHTREPVDEAFMKPMMEEARMTLGTLRFEIAQQAGRESGYDETVADALRWLQHAAN